MIGDGECDDENNNAACGYDGGDCCGPYVYTADCSECQCLGENMISKTSSGPFCVCSIDSAIGCKHTETGLCLNPKICFRKIN